jgi:hypothetical protein
MGPQRKTRGTVYECIYSKGYGFPHFFVAVKKKEAGDGILKRIFSRGFWLKLESSQTRVFVWFSALIFLFYKMLFMNRLEFSCFPDFL